MYRPGFDYYKAGIVLSGLTHRRQQDLFLDSDTPRRTALMQTLDTVNRRFGRQALCSAAELLGEHWNSRLQHRSPRYTTCWEDLLHVGN